MRPEISIITATYNNDTYLSFTIESVISQTFENWEYIIVDDGSSDTTKDVVNGLLYDKRIQYHYQDNQGQAAARNKASRRSGAVTSTALVAPAEARTAQLYLVGLREAISVYR